eukprot:5925526-Amphidinium_carterae.1
MSAMKTSSSSNTHNATHTLRLLRSLNVSAVRTSPNTLAEGQRNNSMDAGRALRTSLPDETRRRIAADAQVASSTPSPKRPRKGCMLHCNLGGN